MISHYKAFSLIELVFTILVIAIISSIALPKLFDTTSKTTLIKLKSDLALIQNGLKEYQNRHILKNGTISLETLDNGVNLFENILQNQNFQNKQEVGFWEKLSDDTYQFYLQKDKTIKFTYDKNNFTFSCDKNLKLCQEVLE